MSSPPKEDDREDIPFSLIRHPKKKTENKNVIEDFNSKISILDSIVEEKKKEKERLKKQSRL